jgi:hypothetical protein
MRPVIALVALLLVIPRTSPAQTTSPPPDAPRFFVHVNPSGTAYSPAKPREFTSLFLRFAEVGSIRTTYPKPARVRLWPLRDVGGGVMLTRQVGIGVSYSRVDYDDAVGLTATIPHPTVLGATASATGNTGQTLARRESATHVSLLLVSAQRHGVEVRLFAGPSFFSYDADMVDDVQFAQAFDPVLPQNAITIDGFTTRDARGRAIGLHAGGEVAYFLTRMIGIAGGVRLSRGTVTVDEEPLTKVSQDIRVGGRLIFVGVRVRFGG